MPIVKAFNDRVEFLVSSDAEPKLKFESTIIAFQFAVDLLKLEDNDPRKAAKTLLKERFALAALEFYAPEDRAKGIGIIETPDADAEVLKVKDPLTGFPVMRSLEFWRFVDYQILDEPFFEGQNISRVRLLGFKSRLPTLKDTCDVTVYLTINKFGVGVISLWYHINEPLASEQLANLELLPMMETPSVTASLPVEVIEAAGKYEKKYEEIAKQVLSAGKKDVPFGQKNPLTFQGLIWFYWGPILNALHDHHYSSQDDMTKSLRSEAFICFPVVIAKKIIPSEDYANTYFEKAPKQIYQIVNQAVDFPSDDVLPEAIEKDIGESISTRRDLINFSTLGCTFAAFGAKTAEIAKKNTEGSFIKIRTLFARQQGEEGLNLDLPRMVLEIYDVTEVVLIQKLLLDIVEMFFSKKDILDMKPKEMVRMHETLATQLAMVSGAKVFRETTALVRFDRAKEVMQVDELVDGLKEKLANIETAQASLHQLKQNIQEKLLGVLLGVVPSILIFFGEADPTFASILSIALSVGATLAASKISTLYWRIIRKREKI